jgi:hypothetical protein
VDVASFSNWRLSLARLNLAMDRCKNSIRVILVGTLWSKARITGSMAIVMFPRFVGMIFTHGAKPADTSQVGRYPFWRIRPGWKPANPIIIALLVGVRTHPNHDGCGGAGKVGRVFCRPVVAKTKTKTIPY